MLLFWNNSLIDLVLSSIIKLLAWKSIRNNFLKARQQFTNCQSLEIIFICAFLCSSISKDITSVLILQCGFVGKLSTLLVGLCIRSTFLFTVCFSLQLKRLLTVVFLSELLSSVCSMFLSPMSLFILPFYDFLSCCTMTVDDRKKIFYYLEVSYDDIRCLSTSYKWYNRTVKNKIHLIEDQFLLSTQFIP